MDAYLISKFIKNTLQNKKVLEHADFLTPTESQTPSVSSPPSVMPDDVSNYPQSIVDNSINDYRYN
jgi:hypothetical protein